MDGTFLICIATPFSAMMTRLWVGDMAHDPCGRAGPFASDPRVPRCKGVKVLCRAQLLKPLKLVPVALHADLLI